MKVWLKRIGLALLSIIGIIFALFGWTKWEYGQHPPIPHKRVTITLPFAPTNEATNLIPMGETIAHPFPGGHPGIDFQWDHSVPIIAVADGHVAKIAQSTDMGQPVIYLELTIGQYVARYKELEKVADGTEKGSVVKQGDTLGYPHCIPSAETGQHCQFHWEFTYSWPLIYTIGPPDRLCPLTYFDTTARQRIEAIWNQISTNDQFKAQFPYICSNVYRDHDQ